MAKIRKSKGEIYFPIRVDKNQAKDMGMVLALIFLLLAYHFNEKKLAVLAAALLLVDLIYPDIYGTAAKLWLGISNIIGTVMSRVVLAMIFFVVVTPVAFVKRIMGEDSLKLRKWKADEASFFKVRNHKFEGKDIDKPY